MTMNMKYIRSITKLVLMLSVVCGAADAKERISVALNVDPAFMAMTYAITHGKVSSELVDIDLHLIDINSLTQAASTKRFDILQLTALTMPKAIAEGVPMKTIGISVTDPPFHGRDIWVKKDSPLRKPEDLKGKTLGIYSLASSAVTLVRIALSKQYGFNVAATGGDIVYRHLRPAAMPVALATGQVDASILPNIECYRALKSGHFRSLVNIDPINYRLFGAAPSSTLFIGYTDRLNAKREAYRAALQLLIDSRDYAQAHPDEVFNKIAAEQKVDPEYLKVWEKEYQGFPVSMTDRDIENLDKLWKWSKELGVISSAPPAASTIWDGTLRK
jgi:NitT/TauT family transport system substrate-binding protein